MKRMINTEEYFSFTDLYSYDRILTRILGPNIRPKSRRDSIQKLLGWLACARRPLRWPEIQCAAALDLDNGTISHDREFREDCKNLCASLVNLSDDGTVSLVHSTAKE